MSKYSACCAARLRAISLQGPKGYKATIFFLMKEETNRRINGVENDVIKSIYSDVTRSLHTYLNDLMIIRNSYLSGHPSRMHHLVR